MVTIPFNSCKREKQEEAAIGNSLRALEFELFNSWQISFWRMPLMYPLWQAYERWQILLSKGSKGKYKFGCEPLHYGCHSLEDQSIGTVFYYLQSFCKFLITLLTNGSSLWLLAVIAVQVIRNSLKFYLRGMGLDTQSDRVDKTP